MDIRKIGSIRARYLPVNEDRDTWSGEPIDEWLKLAGEAGYLTRVMLVPNIGTKATEYVGAPACVATVLLVRGDESVEVHLRVLRDGVRRITEPVMVIDSAGNLTIIAAHQAPDE